MIGLPEMEEFRKIVDEIYQELRVFDGENTRFSVIIRGRRKRARGGGCSYCKNSVFLAILFIESKV